MQKQAKASRVRATAPGSYIRRANTSGAATNRFFTH
jgi:hypothetical protein